MYRGEPVRGIQGGYFIQDIDSAEGCQEECVNDPDCNYFTWNSPAFHKRVQRKKCWLKAGKGLGAKTVGGLDMFIGQGVASADIWFEDKVSSKIDFYQCKSVLRQALDSV